MAEQIQLELPPKPRARRSDPISSHAAADRSEAFVRGHAAIVLRLVAQHPGRTAKQLAELGPLDYWQVARRVKALEEGGWIERPEREKGTELRMFPTDKARAWADGGRT